MSTIEEIQDAITQLPEADFHHLRSWMDHLEDDAWDRQMKQDAADGKLDFLIERVEEHIKHGRLKDFP